MVDVLLLILIGFIAGNVNAVVGGGSLLTVPALIAIGAFGEKEAVGSNRFVLLFMTLISSFRYWQLEKLQNFCLKQLLPGLIPGAFFGAMVVSVLHKQTLGAMVGLLSLLLLSLLFIDPDRGEEEQKPLQHWWVFPLTILLSLFLGFYGGLYGAGVSTMLCFLMIFLMGRTMVQGIGTAQVLTFVISLAASIQFALDGHILYIKIIPLGAGLVAGGYLGPKIAVNIGNQVIKYLFALLVAIASLRLLLPVFRNFY